MTTFDIIPPSLIDAKGDLIVGAGNDTPTRLGAGAAGQVLTVASDGSLVWATPSTGGGASLPNGGTAGQALVKSSSTNGDAAWKSIKRDFSFYVPGSLVATPIPAKFIIPSPIVLTDLLSTVGTAGSGGSTVIAILAGAAQIGTITYSADNTVPTISLTGAGTTLASGTTVSLAVTSVAPTAPKDLSVSLWWL